MNFDVRGDEALQAEKEDKQINQKNGERRNIGKILDAILSLDKYDLPFALVEGNVKKIRRTISHGDEGSYEHVKIYAIQIYLNKMYIYRLCQSSRGIYVFENVMSFHLARPFGLVSNFAPRILESMESKADNYLNSDSDGNSSEESDNSRDTAHASPKKQKTRK
ncbi:hypothetical protein BCV72DRAFT_240710 [Rhizopus microsporus var. microsporus]|uniref:Uncharacterized protein n=2 Tax=Rhizopus microsporus TaxID=58291 RepID=A0A2G4SUA6_RHIZD|nr:uncharacterized protein RHIMIDRAFT_251787 [Rhizopus microsporus ATCC 52813]ORE08111.1 hypothetical protein BCV72DRAFT_240710 [Rhizopus microsporus var. microsporus]PHZ11976.1 hypothetical protein RHIMIDRAFT_251787 [Rhizopus microsporus ATCC 52813]